MLLASTFISWLDAHSGAISALATVILVLITAAYVTVTYMMVKEQRLQGSVPEIARYWANDETDNADLRLHNVGNGTAIETTIVLGPLDALRVTVPDLGRQRTLRPGEDLVWHIAPEEGEADFPLGDLSLTLSYLDHNRSKVFFDVFVIRFEAGKDKVAIRDLGSASNALTRSELRRLARKSLPLMQRPIFRWQTRRTKLSVLMLSELVRGPLRRELNMAAREYLPAWSGQAESYRVQL